MYAARRSVQAVTVFLAAGFCTAAVFAQSSQFLRMETRADDLAALASSSNPCSGVSNHSSDTRRGEAPNAGSAPSPCDHAPSGTLPLASCVSVNPANAGGCAVAGDAVRDDLKTMGKEGHAILRARDKVLEILQTENACSDWYRTKDPDPVATFRTLTFTVDRGADVYVHASLRSGGMEHIRNPYVAGVTQASGPHGTVFINNNGAFFFPIANVVADRGDGGPLVFRGTRSIQVGPYEGGTFRAQVTTLLHEFGHVIDLLPYDADDVGGKSRENTGEVLRFCRAQVEAKELPHTLSASR